MSSLIKQRGTWASFCRRGTAVISRSLCSSSIQGQVSSRTPLEEELRNARPTSEIPGPKAYPLVGSMPKLIKYSSEFCLFSTYLSFFMEQYLVQGSTLVGEYFCVDVFFLFCFFRCLCFRQRIGVITLSNVDNKRFHRLYFHRDIVNHYSLLFLFL